MLLSSLDARLRTASCFYLARLSLVLAMARVMRGPARPERVELGDVEGASSLVEYFKAHARRVYLQIYGESREDRLRADLTKILSGGRLLKGI